MTNEPAYKFIAYAYKPMFGMNTLPREVEYTIGSHDASRDDMLDAFRYFLMAAGYSFSPSESIQVVDEDWEDAQEESDDDLPIAGYRPAGWWTDEAYKGVEGAQEESDDDLPSIKVANFQRGEIFWTDEAEEDVEVKWDAQND